MKALPLVLGAAVWAVLSACTFQTQPNAHAGRVLISAASAHLGGSPASRALASGGRNAPTLAALHPRVSPDARVLAYDDVVSLTYEVTDLDADAVVDSGDVDRSYLSIELYLNPGGHYRITVDVEITGTAPGTNVGVVRYGDQVDFYVDDYYDTYVDLTVHPTEALVFDAASVENGTPSTISAFNPATQARTNVDFFDGAVQVNPADKLFYGPEATLYYFNKAANTIYRWSDISSPIESANVAYAGGSDFTIYAACADPVDTGYLWIVGRDENAAEWTYGYVQDTGSDTPFLFTPVTGAFEYGLTSPTVVPTGIAIDTTYFDVYLTYYAYNATGIQSGLLQYYQDEFFAQFPTDDALIDPFVDADPDDGTKFNASSDSIYTDVTWDQGKAWVTMAPNRALSAGLTDNMGKANVRVFDDFLRELTDITITAGNTYAGPGALPALTTGAGSLVLPNRILGVQNSTLYLGQTDYTAAADDALGPNIVSALDIDTSDVTSY